ncbi:hypothetical protein Tco_0204444 [Tanacetum coccineum]
MEKTQNKPKELLPYGMLLTRLFKHVVFIFPELASDHYLSHDRVIHPFTPHYERKTRSDHGKKRPRDSSASSSSTLVQKVDLVTHGQNGMATHSHIYVAKAANAMYKSNVHMQSANAMCKCLLANASCKCNVQMQCAYASCKCNVQAAITHKPDNKQI